MPVVLWVAEEFSKTRDTELLYPVAMVAELSPRRGGMSGSERGKRKRKKVHLPHTQLILVRYVDNQSFER